MMPEIHDNTKPASAGSYSVGPLGRINYFPIEQAGYLKPAMALILTQKPDGKIVAQLDILYPPSITSAPIRDEDL